MDVLYILWNCGRKLNTKKSLKAKLRIISPKIANLFKLVFITIKEILLGNE